MKKFISANDENLDNLYDDYIKKKNEVITAINNVTRDLRRATDDMNKSKDILNRYMKKKLNNYKIPGMLLKIATISILALPIFFKALPYFILGLGRIERRTSDDFQLEIPISLVVFLLLYLGTIPLSVIIEIVTSIFPSLVFFNDFLFCFISNPIIVLCTSMGIVFCSNMYTIYKDNYREFVQKTIRSFDEKCLSKIKSNEQYIYLNNQYQRNVCAYKSLDDHYYRLISLQKQLDDDNYGIAYSYSVKHAISMNESKGSKVLSRKKTTGTDLSIFG